jgi:hypothetical protein
MRTQKQIAASRENGAKSRRAFRTALKELERLEARDQDVVLVGPPPGLARNPNTGNPVTNPWESP